MNASLHITAERKVNYKLYNLYRAIKVPMEILAQHIITVLEEVTLPLVILLIIITVMFCSLLT